MSREMPDAAPAPGPINISVSDPMNVNDEHQWASALTSLGDNPISRNPGTETNLTETSNDGDDADGNINVGVDRHNLQGHPQQAHSHFAVADPMAQHQQEQAGEEGLTNQQNISHHHQIGEFLHLEGASDPSMSNSIEAVGSSAPSSVSHQIDPSMSVGGDLDHDNVDMLLHHANEQLIIQNNQSLSLEHANVQSHNSPPPRASSGKLRKDFEYRLKEVKKFKAKFGHCMIPHKFNENPSLGTWVDTQRRRYRKYMKAKSKGNTAGVDGATATTAAGRTGNRTKSRGGGSAQVMSQDQVDRLMEIGFVFEPRMSREDTWQRRVSELRAYKAKHGHCNVREDDTSVPGLGKWVSYVRRSNRLAKQGKRAKKLSAEKRRQLLSLGFIFELKEELAMRRFREGLEFLKEFKEKEGHLEVPNFYEPNATMGLCVEDMRTEYRRICQQFLNGGEGSSQIMSSDIVQELSSMGFLEEESLYPYQPSSINVSLSDRGNALQGQSINEGVKVDVTQVRSHHLAIGHQDEVGDHDQFNGNQLAVGEAVPEPAPVHKHLNEQIEGYPATLPFGNIQQDVDNDPVAL